MTVRMNYHDYPYHNWQHAVTVMQAMFAMITVCQQLPFHALVHFS